jgi:hypothetical protein
MDNRDTNVAVLEASRTEVRDVAAPPEPSYAPFLLALGVTMVFWGVATSPVMSVAGIALFAWALWLWIAAIARGWRK